MPNKRSRCNKTQHFDCPYCQERLWRLGGPKYHLFYKNAEEIKVNLNIPAKKAKFIAASHPTYVDHKTWIEEFFCEEHGQIWLLLSRKDSEKTTATLPRTNDWSRTTKTIDPQRPNPSVGEFTYRMSRMSHKQR